MRNSQIARRAPVMERCPICLQEFPLLDMGGELRWCGLLGERWIWKCDDCSCAHQNVTAENRPNGFQAGVLAPGAAHLWVSETYPRR